MEEIILNASERAKQHGKFREPGLVAGVLYGDGVSEGTLVKFEEIALKKILMKHGANAKVWVKYGENKKFGFIKELQRNPVTAKIIHVDIQLISKDHEVKLQLPITFKGEHNLTAKELQLQISKSEIDVFGKMALMPEFVEINVSEKELGDIITLKDFNFDKEIKITDKEDQIYATITHMKEEFVEKPVEAETATEAVAVAKA